MRYQEKLDNIIKKNNSLASVGLDSNYGRIPDKFKRKECPQFAFNKWIIEQTNELVAAYKLNSAFYEAKGALGIKELKMTCEYLQEEYPEIVIILDAKRADIGSTNKGYIEFVFEYLGADAVTLQPYFGREAMDDFLAREDKGCIFLCRTSNPGAEEFQDLKIAGEKLYKVIARQIADKWNKNNNCLLVVGATYPEELAEVRKIVGEMTLLVPGIGAQGGDVEKTMQAGLNSQNAGMIINSSRGIIFSDNPRGSAQKLRDIINKYRS